MTIRVLLNPDAGRRGSTGEGRVERALRDAGVQAEVRAVPPALLEQEVARAAREGAAVVGIGGGDGTLLTAANALAGTRTALAPIPLGTLNHFARRLGVPDAESAARALAAARVRVVPLGVLDDRLFLNTATIGLYAHVVLSRERLRPWLSKWPAAAVALVQRLVRLRPLRVTLMAEGRSVVRTTPLVWVGMGRGASSRRLDAGQEGEPTLEVVVLRTRGRLDLAFTFLRVLSRLLRRSPLAGDPALEVFHTRTLLVDAPRTVGITLDGEVLRARPPLFVGVQDDALRVVSAVEVTAPAPTSR